MGTRGSRRMRRSLGSAAAVMALAAGMPAPAAAVDPTETIEVPGDSLAAVVIDLDGDGEREVVRLVRSPSEGVVIDAWRHGTSGWDRVPGTQVVSNPATGTAVLLRAAHGNGDRLLAVTAEQISGDEFGAICCLSLSVVSEENGAISLTPLVADDLDRGATYLQSLDLDADGTDELVTVRASFDDQGVPVTSSFEVQAWRNGRYVQVGAHEADGSDSIVYGETDGVAGAELLIGPNASGRIHRWAYVDGELRLEVGHIAMPERADEYGYLSAIAGELIVIVERTAVRTLSWPSGGDPRDVDRLDGVGEYPWITALGTGSDALLVQLGSFSFQGGETPDATVYDLELRPIGVTELSPESAAISRLLERGFEGVGIEVYPYAYAGLLPPELMGGRPSLAASGVLIAADGEGGYEARPMSPLAGLHPHGTAGPGDGWLAASRGLWYAPPDVVYLSPGSAASVAAGRLILVPVESVLEPSAVTAASIELDGAVLDAAANRLFSRPEGFSAVVDAPPGTLVFAGSRRIEAYEVGAEPLTVEHTLSTGNPERNLDFEYGVLVITPDGRVMIEEWEGMLVREQPELEATGTTTAFELRARVRGTVTPYADVLVDGRRAQVAADGAFEVAVDAPPWPVDVVVVARDPVGNETSARVQVIGFVDYRGLPWIPIVGLVTVLVGAYVFLRVPRRRAGPTPARSGDGTLEEIELD